MNSGLSGDFEFGAFFEPILMFCHSLGMFLSVYDYLVMVVMHDNYKHRKGSPTMKRKTFLYFDICFFLSFY